MSREDDYKVVKPQKEYGFDLTNEEDKLRHLVARNGDHIIIPFQYDLCRFWNIRWTDPEKSHKDVLFLRTLRQENVDVFWSRKPSTVEATRRNSKNLLNIEERVRIEVLSTMGYFP